MSQSVKMLILLAEMVIALSKPNSVTEKRTVMMAQMRMHVILIVTPIALLHVTEPFASFLIASVPKMEHKYQEIFAT
jgi:hypothetical protein